MTVTKLFARGWTRTRDVARDEAGYVTPVSLLAFLATAVIGGLAVDLSSVVAARTQLQVAADLAAHAALYNRDIQTDPDVAKQRALDLARDSMPSSRYGDIITVNDIEFGDFDPDTFTFTPNPSSRNASRVVAFRVSERTNSVSSFLLRLAGIDEWDIVRSAVFETYRPTCFREGLVGDNVVDLQSNTAYSNGFCVHSNEYVSVNSNNYYEPGTVVSMPDTGDIELPRSGYESNDGLYEALRPGKYRLRIINQVEEGVVLAGMTDPKSPHYRADYLDPTADPIDKTVTWKNNMGPSDFEQGRVNKIQCGGKKVNLAGETYENMVIIGYACDFKFNNGAILTNATLLTTHTGVKSIDAPNGLQLGIDDDCAGTGGAQIITYGGVEVASGLQMYGSQIIAVGPIAFQALASGIKGASIVSGETIEGTSNSSFGFCGSGMGNNFEAEYFRMRM